MNKITIIGAGSVGSTIAYALTITGIASNIVMIDINGNKALGEALDIRQGTPFCHPCSVYAGGYPEAENSDIVIITSGVARKPGQSRLDLAQTNVNIMKDIIPQITKYAPNAIYIIVSNPVDVLTYVFNKCSDIPQERIIGSGTILDTSRLRARLSEYYNVNQKNVHAYVLGEHGDSSFIPWSLANISNVPLADYASSVKALHEDALGMDSPDIFPKLDYADIENYVRKSGARVIARKGATFYAVAISVCHICKCLFSGIDTTLTVSTMVNGEYGINDVCLSLLNVVGDEGAHSKVLLPLTDTEIAQLRHSAESLRAVIDNIEI
ncbi:MAG: L-lactate dehydrogenase [Clostridia bacterium]|jgi:L-lactate dehydrogenase|nr:L-lactate dehydrogenase [Clostridia bacterium]